MFIAHEQISYRAPLGAPCRLVIAKRHVAPSGAKKREGAKSINILLLGSKDMNILGLQSKD